MWILSRCHSSTLNVSDSVDSVYVTVCVFMCGVFACVRACLRASMVAPKP